MTTYKFKGVTVKREYEVEDAPDLQDSAQTRRRVIRPRKVTLNLVPTTNLVYGAVIEGRQVRRDGELAGSMMILAGISRDPWGYHTAPPSWLNELLADEDLKWTPARTR